MVIHIKDEETDRLVRQYADRHRLGITEAVRKAVTAGLAAPENDEDRPVEERLAPLLARLDRMPRPRGRSTAKQFFDDLWEEPHGDFSKTDDREQHNLR